MKRHSLLFLVVLSVAASLHAQEAIIASPVTPPAENKVIVVGLDMTRTPAMAIVNLAFQDSNGNELRRQLYKVPQDTLNPGTELQDFATAIISPRTNETGIATRRLNYRILGYLVDFGRLTGVTLAP